MWTSIILFTIQFVVGPLILLVVGYVLDRRIKGVREQVTNDHGTNLRDDVDLILARQEEQAEVQGHLAETVASNHTEFREFREESRIDHAQVSADIRALTERTEKVEQGVGTVHRRLDGHIDRN